MKQNGPAHSRSASEGEKKKSREEALALVMGAGYYDQRQPAAVSLLPKDGFGSASDACLCFAAEMDLGET